MRVLLTPVGSAGDNLPFIGLGAELARRGHDVSIATSAHFAATARAAGLEFVSIATDAEYHAAIDDPDLFHPRKGLAAVLERVGEFDRRLFEVIAAQRGRGPVVVVAHSLDFASRAFADAQGLPVVRVHLQPSILRTVHAVPITNTLLDLPRLPRWAKAALWALADRSVIDPVLAPVVNELRGRLGLGPVRRVFASQINSALRTLAMFPAWYAAPQPDWPASLVQCGFPLFDAAPGEGLGPALERFLADGEPPLVFTPGSAMRFGHAFFAAAVEACRGLGRRGVLLTRHAEQLPAALPPGVAHFDYAPLGRLLPRSAALVHHGGVGTTAAALAGGVPQVVVPFSHDQPDNAARVLRLGVGARIAPRSLDAGRLAVALGTLLGAPAVVRRCREVAALCRADHGIVRACDLIEAAGSRGTRAA